jgi:hypothetical protein
MDLVDVAVEIPMIGWGASLALTPLYPGTVPVRRLAAQRPAA